MFRMSNTPGRIRWAGRRLGQDNQAVYCEELGLSEDGLAELHEKGVL
jgi:crotonobetainyl-CoA:carnitine CoA-transferase CaiB-like acyl-CoA transferase